MTEVKNRSEILFLYDVKDANPNGDPMDENKPRIDEETGINIVTDVRLKRTIRDHLAKKQNIFIKEEINPDGTQRTREERIKELKEKLKIKTKEDEKKILCEYIDLRLFGATIALSAEGKQSKGESITWTGPVQFRFGRSLHQVEPKTVKGTSVMPSKAELTRGTFIETQILPYSLISFYGIVNENAGKTTTLQEEDIGHLLDGIWNGTKNLITRSKNGIPRLLLRVVYKENNYHIGDLDKKIKLIDKNEKQIEGEEGKKIRDISEIKMDITKLMEVLSGNKDKIEKVEYEINPDVMLIGKLEIDGVKFEKLNLESPKE